MQWPAPKNTALAFSDQPLQTYESTLTLPLALGSAKGRGGRLAVRVQN
jgi:hypothetical protein